MSKRGSNQFEEISSLLTALIATVTLIVVIITLGESFISFRDFGASTVLSISIAALFASLSATVLSRFYIYRKREMRQEVAEERVRELRERIRHNRVRLEKLERDFESLLDRIQDGIGDSEKRSIAQRADDIKDKYEATQMQYHFLVFSYIYISEFSGEEIESNLRDIGNLVEDYQKITSLFDDIEYGVVTKKEEEEVDSSIQKAIERVEEGEEPPSLSEIASFELDSETRLPV